MLNQTAIINCNSRCELEEVWMCMARDVNTGLPNGFMPCPAGARNASDSCRKSHCEYVVVPVRNQNRPNELADLSSSYRWANFVYVILAVLVFKYVLFFAASCYEFVRFASR